MRREKDISVADKNDGMGDIDSQDVRCYLAAHLLRNINHFIEENNDIKWRPVYVNRQDGEVAFDLKPFLKTVAVYNNWLKKKKARAGLQEQASPCFRVYRI